jgi:secreted trypsin-like serine protease
MRLPFSRRRTRRIALAGLAAGAVAALVTAVVAPSVQAKPASSDASQPGTLIVGGGQAVNDEYPFMAALLSKGPGTAYERQFCGASLVDPYTILTAAHCVEGAKPKDLQVAVGRTQLSDSEQGEVRGVVDINVHPRYLNGQGAYDSALLLLRRPVDSVEPIALPTPGTDSLLRPGQKATVIGWGTTAFGQANYPDRLREVNVPILSHDECLVSYPEYDKKVDFCAGTEGKDSCQGDSGGPIFRTVPGTQTRIQIGTVSRGDGCAAQGAPGIYTSTSSASLWNTWRVAEDGTGNSLDEFIAARQTN